MSEFSEGIVVTNQYCIHDAVKGKLHFGKARYRLVSKNVKTTRKLGENYICCETWSSVNRAETKNKVV